MKSTFRIVLCITIVLSLTMTTAWGGTTARKKSTATTAAGTPVAKKLPSKLTKVMISPAYPKVGEKIKVTVYGTPSAGDCQIILSMGDGSAMFLYGNSKSFPYFHPDQSHWRSYDKPGTYKLIAMGKSTASCQCSGQVSVMVTVKPKFTFKPFKKCPSGWKLKQSNSDGFICVPKCPTSFQCPEGYNKECTECEVRCYKPIQPPS